MKKLINRDYVYGLNIYENKIKKYYDYSKDYNQKCLYIADHDKDAEDWIDVLGIDLDRLTFSSQDRAEVRRVRNAITKLKNVLSEVLTKDFEQVPIVQEQTANKLLRAALAANYLENQELCD
jgi:hypothetical protein